MKPLSVIVSFAAAMLISASAVSSAQSEQWIMASGYPEANFMTKNIRLFIEEVARDTEVDIELKSNAALIKEAAIKSAVQRGQVQMGDARLGIFGNEDPMLDLAGVPFLAPDYPTVWLLKDIQKQYLTNWFADQGIRLLFQAPWPGSGFYSKFPISALSDLEGKRLRIYSAPTQKMGEMLGFNATILPFAEIPQAFATGLIEALFTSPQTGIDIQAWDNTKYFTYVGATLATNAVFVNEAAFQALPSEEQVAILEAAERAELRAWEMSAATTEEQMKVLEENGMTLSSLPAEVTEKLDEVGDALLQDWRGSASPEAVEVLDRYLSLRNAGGDAR